MSYPVARAVVKCFVAAALNKTAADALYVNTLSGRDIGLKTLKVGVERDISEEDGYYQGIRDQNDTQRASGTIEFTVRLVDDTKFLVGKEGMIIHLERVIKNASGTTQVTDKSFGMVKMCTPEEDGRGGFQIPLNAMMLSDPVVTVV